MRRLHGEDGLNELLNQAQSVVTISIRHPHILKEWLAQLPKGASIINPGRGSLIDEQALFTLAMTASQGTCAEHRWMFSMKSRYRQTTRSGSTLRSSSLRIWRPPHRLTMPLIK